MSKLTVELEHGNEQARESLKRWLLGKARAWIKGLLEAEMAQHLRRGRYEPLADGQSNYRNGYRPRRLNLCGLGQAELKVPGYRQGTFKSVLLPDRRGQRCSSSSLGASRLAVRGAATRKFRRVKPTRPST